jgi:hypothetical protein
MSGHEEHAMKRHRDRFRLPFLPVFLLAIVLGQIANAGVINRFYNTGVSGSSVVLLDGSLDLHYRIADDPVPEYGIVDSSYDPDGFDDSLSKSIFAPAGYIAFVLEINFGGSSQVLPETVSVMGNWSSSLNAAAVFDILLNGQPIDANAPTTPGPFTIPAGSAFLAGINYLTFIAIDLSGSNDPNYLRVELNAQGASVPEPSMLLLWSCGLCGTLLTIARRQRQVSGISQHIRPL